MSDILRTNLAQANFDVISLRNGREALEKARQELPDVILLDTSLPDIDGFEVCHQLKEALPTRRIPVLLIGAEPGKKGRSARATEIADCYIVKPFDPKDVVSLVQLHLNKKKRAENISPATGLPNQLQVNNEINYLINRNSNFGAIFVDITNLKIFNRVYGFEQGDRAIVLLATIVTEALKRSGNPDDLAGHLGGGNFVVVTSVRKVRNICRRIINEFDRRKKALYSHEDLLRGFIEFSNHLGAKEQFPLMSVRAAVVTNDRHTFQHYLEVSEAAQEQLDYLKLFPGVTSYYDLPEPDTEFEPGLLPKPISREYREELSTVQGAMAWLVSLTGEMKAPVIGARDYLDRLESGQTKKTASEKAVLKEIGLKLDKLEGVVDTLESFILRQSKPGIVPDEINLRSFLGWIVKQLKSEVGQHEIILETKDIKGTHRLMIDNRALAQCLIYILRGEIETSPAGTRVQIDASPYNGDFIKISINSTRYIPPRVMRRILQNGIEISYGALKNKLYPAKVLVRGLGGKLNFRSRKTEGTTYTLILPRKWQSWMPDINSLLYATDISRQQARQEINNLQDLLAPLTKDLPPELSKNLSRIHERVQELGVLGNRSLYLAENLNNRLEAQQDRLLQHEIDQISTLEAVQTICGEIARFVLPDKNLFDPDSARRVSRNAAVLAGEFKLPEADTQALRFAAVLKDLGLALCPRDLVEFGLVASSEQAEIIREHFNPVWKSLSMIPFYTASLALVLYRYERYNGTGERFGVSNSSIPLGARILAVVDTFDFLTSGLSPDGAIIPAAAVQKIADASGMLFDPDVVNSFLAKWRRQEISIAEIETPRDVKHL